MFTGIVEETGTVVDLADRNGRTELTIRGHMALDGTRIGDSIAVNGVCLTALELTPTTFMVELQPETLRRTNLGDVHSGDAVNLERPLAANGRFGGHIVQGHIDGTGVIRGFAPDGPAVIVSIEAPIDLMRYIVAQGFIAVDGTSLTVVDVNREQQTFTLAIITHTQDAVTLTKKSIGDRVNIEVDIMAKYIESMLGQR